MTTIWQQQKATKKRQSERKSRRGCPNTSHCHKVHHANPPTTFFLCPPSERSLLTAGRNLDFSQNKNNQLLLLLILFGVRRQVENLSASTTRPPPIPPPTNIARYHITNQYNTSQVSARVNEEAPAFTKQNGYKDNNSNNNKTSSSRSSSSSSICPAVPTW